MADWVVQPFEALGPISMGASRSEVRAVLGEQPREFQKGHDSGVAEAYGTAGVHAYYDSTGRVEFVEAFAPCSPVYAGVRLLGADADAVVARLATWD